MALQFGHVNRRLDVLIALSGVVTTIPLVCFAQAVRMVSLVTIGVLQYLSPTLQLIVAVAVFDEDVRTVAPDQLRTHLAGPGDLRGRRRAGRGCANISRARPPEPVPEPIDGGVPITDSQLLDVRSSARHDREAKK